jgi:hypothetical protein
MNPWSGVPGGDSTEGGPLAASRHGMAAVRAPAPTRRKSLRDGIISFPQATAQKGCNPRSNVQPSQCYSAEEGTSRCKRMTPIRRFHRLTFRQAAGSIVGLAFTCGAAIQNVTRTQQRTGSIYRTLDCNIVAFIVAASKDNF